MPLRRRHNPAQAYVPQHQRVVLGVIERLQTSRSARLHFHTVRGPCREVIRKRVALPSEEIVAVPQPDQNDVRPLPRPPKRLFKGRVVQSLTQIVPDLQVSTEPARGVQPVLLVGLLSDPCPHIVAQHRIVCEPTARGGSAVPGLASVESAACLVGALTRPALARSGSRRPVYLIASAGPPVEPAVVNPDGSIVRPGEVLEVGCAPRPTAC